MLADLEATEFTAIRRLLERLTTTPYGGDAARALVPAPQRTTALRMQRSVTAARLAIEQGTSSIGRLPDIRAAVRQSTQAGSALTGGALAHVSQLLEAMDTLAILSARYPGLYPDATDHLQPPAVLRAALRGAVTAAGRIRDEASPRLQALAAQIAAQRAVIHGQLTKRLAALGITAHLDHAIITSGARLMLSLPVAAAADVKGVRRGPSAHGRELLVEPLEVVALNNHLETIGGQWDAEELIIRRALTDKIRSARDGLETLLSAVAWIDLAFAGGHLSVHLNASAPVLSEGPGLDLRGAYHPAMLLAYADHRGPQPVPLSIHLDADQPMLLITGPNTGGKTVALKTIGLLVAMAYCGLHIPTEETTTIGEYTRLIVDIGDHQSLWHQLSTFAAHVVVLKRLLAEADGHSLVLMDELGTGTDPEEGAALAMAVLDELADRGVQGVVTTHLSPLKVYADQHRYLTNATMHFDTERLSPTYELVIGQWGSSHGLAIAGRSGLPPALLERARQYLLRIAPTRGPVDH